MKFIIVFFISALSISAQTTVYLRASGPQAVQINGASNTTPVILQTTTPHGYVGGETIVNAGVCTGIATDPASGQSPVNGIRKVKAVIDTTHFSITDLSGTNIAGNGPWVNCAPFVGATNSSQWTGKLTPFVLGAQPLGWLDGPNGTLMRKLSLGTANGLTSLSVSSNLASATTSYNHGLTTGDKISVWGSGNTNLNTGNGTGAGFAYSVTVVDATHFTFPAAGVPGGTYSGVNTACGPSATPNDLRGGTQDCLRISQLAYVGNPTWRNVLSAGNMATAFANNQGANNYKSVYDGGGNRVNSTAFLTPSYYAEAALQFLVDPSNDYLLSVVVYGLKFAPHIMGVNWSCFKDGQSCADNNMQDTVSWMYEGLAWLYSAGSQYLTPSEKQRFLDQIYNDIDDPSSFVASEVDMDLSLYNHNNVLSADVAQGGTGTSITLSASDSMPDGYYVGTIINIFNLPGNLLFGNYVSGITATGATGTYCLLGGFNGGGSGPDKVRVYLTGTNTIASGAPLAIYPGGINGGYTSYPTTASATNGTATCTGTATISTLTGRATNIGVGTVTSYVASTKIATISAAWTNGTPGAGTAYKILTSMTISNKTPLASGATVTGIHTTWNTPGSADHINVGDAIAGANTEAQIQGSIGGTFSIVTAVNSDTSLTVINNLSPTASTTVPQMAWIAPQWQTGDVGLRSVSKHWVGDAGAQGALYPIAGGGLNTYFYQPSEGGNNNIGTSFGQMVLDFVTAPDDPRAVRDLAIAQSYGFDFELRHYMDYIAGWSHSGAAYGWAVTYVIGVWARVLEESVPSFPSMDLQGNWLNQISLGKMFAVLPDLHATDSTLIGWPVGYGSETSDQSVVPGSPSVLYFLADPNFIQNPTTNATKYYRNWLQNATFDMWNSSGSSVDYQDTLILLQNDPRQASLSYSAQPLQYAFYNSSASTCATLTGWPCSTIRGDVMVSRTSWTDRTATHLFFEVRDHAGDHDQSENGITHLWKVGPLLNLDALPGAVSNGFDMTNNGDMMSFGTPGVATVKQWPVNAPVPANPGTSRIIRWASANHGTWDPSYGDQNSLFAYVASDVTKAYTNPINYAQRSIVHLKDFTINFGTGEEIIVQYDSADVTGTPTNIQTHLHFAQNGQGPAYNNAHFGYSEGNTTCPIDATCANLNTNRVIQSMEDGSTDSFNPARNYGVVTKFFSPGTITVQDDTPPLSITSVSHGNPIVFNAPGHGLTSGRTVMIYQATGAWAAINSGFDAPTPITVLDANNFSIAGDSSAFAGTFNGIVNADYVGGRGWSHRVSICAGASCGATVNTFDSVVVTKVMKNLGDTTLIAAALNPDANWTGVQTADKVVVLARGGVMHSTMAGFTTTHSGTAQYLFGGLTAGSYAVTVGGTAVTGSPFTVTAGDNSIEFESTAGAVSINGSVGVPLLVLSPGSLSYSCVSGGSNPAAQIINVSATNATLDNWSAAKTQSWLTLAPASGSAAGSFAASVNCAGQPVGIHTDTITVSSTTTGITNSPQTVAVSLTVSAPAGVSSIMSGRTAAKGNVVVH